LWYLWCLPLEFLTAAEVRELGTVTTITSSSRSIERCRPELMGNPMGMMAPVAA
jgi:hypothetical protein